MKKIPTPVAIALVVVALAVVAFSIKRTMDANAFKPTGNTSVPKNAVIDPRFLPNRGGGPPGSMGMPSGNAGNTTGTAGATGTGQ